MVKAHLLFLVGITSAFLLTVQLIALQYLVHQVRFRNRVWPFFKKLLISISFLSLFREQSKSRLNG